MIAEARQYLADVIEPLGIPVHAYPPGSVSPPCAIVVPDDPYYLLRTLNGATGSVGLEVRLITAATDGGIRHLDALLEETIDLLTAARVRVEPIGAPTVDPDAGGLVAHISVVINWKD